MDRKPMDCDWEWADHLAEVAKIDDEKVREAFACSCMAIRRESFAEGRRLERGEKAATLIRLQDEMKRLNDSIVHEGDCAADRCQGCITGMYVDDCRRLLRALRQPTPDTGEDDERERS